LSAPNRSFSLELDKTRLIPFTQRFTGARADRTLPRKLRDELPGVLAWMVRGCSDWQWDGLGESNKVVAATEGYRAEMDVLAVAGFIEERCIVKPGVWCKFAGLYAAYCEWCAESNEHPESSRRFADSLTERGYAKDIGGKNTKIRRGIALRHDGDPDPARVADPPPDEGRDAPDDKLDAQKNGNRVTAPPDFSNPQKHPQNNGF
jgi:phage/plasmid-associated DNA primase